MNEKILLIFVKKDTGKYDHYESYTLTEKLTKECIYEKAEEYNLDESKTTTVKIYEDELLLDFVEDARRSYGMKNLVDMLRSICSNIQDSVDNLEIWTGEIENLLKDSEGDDD